MLRRLHSTESTGTRQKSRPEQGNNPKQTKEPKAPYPHNRGIPPCVCRAGRPCKTRGLGGGMHDLPRSCHGGMGVWVVGSKVSWGVEVTTRMMFGCIFEMQKNLPGIGYTFVNVCPLLLLVTVTSWFISRSLGLSPPLIVTYVNQLTVGIGFRV